MRLASIACFLGVAAGLSAPARASVIYSYVTDAPSYSGPAGSIVPVNIYLLETVTGSSGSFITANGGLLGAGAAVNVVGTTGGTAASFGSGSAVFNPNTTDFGNPPVLASSLYYNQGAGPAANNLEFQEAHSNTQSGVNPTAGKVLLGTLDIQVGTGKTTYDLTSLFNDTINGGNSATGQTNSNTVTTNPVPFGSDLDVTQPGVYTGANDAPATVFTVNSSASPVPEPASLAVFAAGAMGLLIRRRRA